MNQRGIRAIVLLLSPFIFLTFSANGALLATETLQIDGTSTSALKPGEAKGTLTAGGLSVELKFAYAHKVKGFADPSKQEFEILLTTKPIQEELLRKGDDFSDVLFREGEGLILRTTPEGRVTTVFLKMTIVRESGSTNMSAQKGASGEVMKIGAVSIEGKSKLEGSSSGKEFSYDVAFRVPIMKQGQIRK